MLDSGTRPACSPANRPTVSCVNHRPGPRASAPSRRARAGRVWLPRALGGRWCGAHGQALDRLDAAAQRLHAVRQGFAALPVDDGVPAQAPARVAIDAAS